MSQKLFNTKSYVKSNVFKEWHDDPKRKKRNKKTDIFISNKSNVLLIGAPNTGKSTFFNKVTNGTASVSNIDRLTVANTVAKLKVEKNIKIVDLPGLYNLSHPIDEELVVAHEMSGESFFKIVNIIGAQSIERDLYLSIQALETGMMSTLVINMIDEINKKALNIKKLSSMLNNVKIIECQANRNIGVKEAGKNIVKNKKVNSKIVEYPKEIENLIKEISLILPKRKISNRYYSLMFLEGNQFIIDYYLKKHNSKAKQILKILKKHQTKNIPEIILQTRKKFINLILNKCITSYKDYFSKDKLKQKKIDKQILKKWFGIPLFLVLMIGIYYVTFGPYMGGSLKELFGENFLNQIVADQWIGKLFDLMHANEWVKGLFVDGLFKGFFAILSFTPTLIILFTLVNIIQQIGILSRISILLDEFLERFGISGRSVINLLTGFGCNVPSIMMARSSNSKKEKIISILISPFIACSARVIVFSFICNAIFGFEYGWIGMILLTMTSGAIALLMGLFFSKTMFRKTKSFFMIEMVDWRKPDFIVIGKIVWLQLKEFIKKAGTVIIAANILIWLFLHLGPSGLLNNFHIEDSFICYIAKGINFIMYPVGFYSSDGWKLTASLITAFPAKEIAVSNIQMLFGSTEAFTTYISSGMHIAQGMSYLVIFMLYLPCAATIGVIKKESSWKILWIHILTSIIISYSLGIFTYWITYAFLLI